MPCVDCDDPEAPYDPRSIRDRLAELWLIDRERAELDRIRDGMVRRLLTDLGMAPEPRR